MRMKWGMFYMSGLLFLLWVSVAWARNVPQAAPADQTDQASVPAAAAVDSILANADKMIAEGRRTFRYDTFGDESFWGDTLQLHQAIQGERFGGVGPGVSPKAALAAGLKVDMDALPASLVRQLRAGTVNLDDPATTLALLKLNAIVGVTGFFNQQNRLRAVGIQCAICHSTVDGSFASGIGHRLDGWANGDVNSGASVAVAAELEAGADLLGTDVATVQEVRN